MCFIIIIAHLFLLILLHFKFEETTRHWHDRCGIVVIAWRWPTPLTYANRLCTTVRIHQMVRSVRIAEDWLRWKRRWRWRWSPLRIKMLRMKNAIKTPSHVDTEST